MKVAFIAFDVLITPMQFGPRTRIPCRRAMSPTFRSSSAPSRPVSRNPAEITTTTLVPFSPACSMTWGTATLGTTTTTISTSPGIEARSG